jgi:hypothetical protein
MKKNIITIILALASVFIASAQSTNPLNYSGRMYVEAIEIIATPRYVSYEDHAILSQQMRIPSVEITKIDDGVKIARMVLSSKPYVADESEALRNMLMGLGTM